MENFKTSTGIVQKGALTTSGNQTISESSASAMMKKVAKRLKFWSRKTTKWKKSMTTLLVAPSFPCDDYLHPCYSPSAPPLPPWVELDYECGHGFDHLPTFQMQVPFQMRPESVPCDDEAIVPILPGVHCESEGCYSYREYGYTVPVLGPGSAYAIKGGGNARGERAGWFFGCLVKLGMHMFGCLFPCLSIREAAGARTCRAHY